MSGLTDFYLSFYKVLNDFNVEYMTVGGHAVIYHGYVRATNDLDLWVNTEIDNLERLYKSLVHLGYDESNCKEAVEYLQENHMIKLPKGNDKIELLDSFMLKSDFNASYQNHVSTIIKGIRVKLIGYNDLLKCKLESNRPKDLLDVKSLQEIRKLSTSKKHILDEKESKTYKLKKDKGNGFSM